MQELNQVMEQVNDSQDSGAVTLDSMLIAPTKYCNSFKYLIVKELKVAMTQAVVTIFCF